QFAPWVKKIIKAQHKERFSKSALETLAIIAYRQPISRAEIEEIRGVNVDGIMRFLLEKGLIQVSGKKDIPGKPWLYSTTKEFLVNFGLNSLQELPPLNELELNIN
ncbi:MAG: SMC-Scp complex subunit ScpB, partial [Candidatus Aureabacteria bacterium]|nr:SMC-Scp complex subunit ScpB [Candidatus Auribacterota bacterium]